MEGTPAKNKPDRSAATEAAYRARYALLEANARLALTIPPAAIIDVRRVAVVVKEHAIQAGLRKSTWRQYRAAFVFVMEELGTPEAREAMDYLLNVNPALVVSNKTLTRTSSSKQKGLPPKDLHTLRFFLQECRSEWGKPLLTWLEAGLATGLRPVEWWNAELTELVGQHAGTPALLVRNAKHSNQRAHGEMRTVPLGHVTPEEMRHVINHMKNVSEHDFHRMYENCRNQLLRICRLAFKGRKVFPTLYSPRHQFTADMKASGLNDEERATLLGHSNGDTNNWHYGKQRVGYPRKGLIVVGEELERVRKARKTGGRRIARTARHEKT